MIIFISGSIFTLEGVIVKSEIRVNLLKSSSGNDGVSNVEPLPMAKFPDDESDLCVLAITDYLRVLDTEFMFQELDGVQQINSSVATFEFFHPPRRTV